MSCEKVIFESDIIKLLENVSYSDIYGSIEKQKQAIKAWRKIFKVWNIKLENSAKSPSGHQVHLPGGQSASYTTDASAAQTVDAVSQYDHSISDPVYDVG